LDLAQARVIEVGNQLHVTHGDDKRLYVEFDMLAVEQPYESGQAGRPIYKELPYITIMFPGDQTKKVVRPVKMEPDSSGPSDPERFPKQWERFQKQQLQVQDGTPLEEWPVLNRADVKSFKALNIHTVEALAAVSDPNLANIGMGGRVIRDKAIAWLKAAEGGADISRLISENATLKADIEMLKRQIKGLPPAAQSAALLHKPGARRAKETTQ
jgi:hypothetical protein